MRMLAGALLLAGVSAFAQNGMFDSVQRDLDRTASNPYLSGSARGHVDHARHELWEFQRRWYGGRFSLGDLDGAIKSVNKVVNAGSIDYRDRRALQNDLSRMREFRAERSYR